MSHVDDGELTAYADGAYPGNDPEALRISAHLSACDNCRTRLEQAHALRDRAAGILAYATPLQVMAPPFETLEAQLSTSSRRPRRHVNLAWAASIMLALGLGWFGRGAWQNPPVQQRVAADDAPAAAATEAAADLGQSPAQPAAPQPAPQVAAEPRPAAPARREPARSRLSGSAVPGEEAALGATAGAAASRAASRAAAPPPAATAPELAEAKVAADAIANRQYMSAADAERRGINVPRIPELPVTRIAMNQDTTFIDQSLPDGRVVRLTVTTEREEARREPRSAARSAAAEMAQAQKSVAPANVVIRHDGKLITVTGDLPADSLRALAGKIR